MIQIETHKVFWWLWMAITYDDNHEPTTALGLTEWAASSRLCKRVAS